MCLYLNKNFRKETEEFKNSSEILIGYKELPHRMIVKLISPYQGFEYKIRKNISDRTTVELSEFEILNMEVKYGFHFYKEIDYFSSSWFKFEIDPKDLIAVGTFDNHESFVATKCKLIRKVEILNG